LSGKRLSQMMSEVNFYFAALGETIPHTSEGQRSVPRRLEERRMEQVGDVRISRGNLFH